MEQESAFALLPREVQAIIAKSLIDPTDFEGTMRNIASFAEINWYFNRFVNHPQNMETLVQSLANYFYPVHDEADIAEGLANMPGIKSKEFREWLVQRKLQRAKEEELRQSALYNKYDRIKELIKEGVNVNARNEEGLTALDLALQVYISGQHLGEPNDTAFNSIRALLNAADVNARGSCDFTPIIFATSYQDIPLMKEILKYKPDLTIPDSFGQTPFHFARVCPFPEIMRTLEDYVNAEQLVLPKELKDIITEYNKSRSAD